MRKLNSDAAIYKDGIVGFRFVVRDEDGEVLIAGASSFKIKGNSTLIEGLAILHALRTTLAGGIVGFQVECHDCKPFIDALKEKTIVEVYSNLVVKDIRAVARTINCEQFCFVPRNANKLAHSLAHFVKDVGAELVWLEEIPSEFELIHLNDVIHD